MNKRFFAFGCSYTSYCYPTWADYIGVGYDQYYNFGHAGCSNTFMMNRFIEAHDKLKFNKNTDTVFVMLTGFGRFSYIGPNEPNWQTHGDLYSYCANTKDPVLSFFSEKIWSDDFAVHQSWIAYKTIKSILLDLNVPHKFLMGIDNSLYRDDIKNLSQRARRFSNEIYQGLDIARSLDEWKNLEGNGDSPYWEDIAQIDGHPSHKAHFKFMSEHFPELVTSPCLELLNFWSDNHIYSSQSNQGTKFNNLWANKTNLAKGIGIY